MGSGEGDNEKILELIGSIARRLLSQKGIVRRDDLINALEFLRKSTSEPRVRENSIRAIKMLSDREH